MPEGQLKHPPVCVEITAAKIHRINDFLGCRSLRQSAPAVTCCVVRPATPGRHHDVIARDKARVKHLGPPDGIFHIPKVEAALCFRYYHPRPIHDNVKDRLRILGSGVSVNLLHGFGRVNLQSASRREGPGLAAQRITSSAWKRSVGGSVRPKAWAVFRLMTSSKVVGCSTGRSAGLAPLRILST
jgi:hypothetical protein